jgi:hypothetical protein
VGTNIAAAESQKTGGAWKVLHFKHFPTMKQKITRKKVNAAGFGLFNLNFLA